MRNPAPTHRGRWARRFGRLAELPSSSADEGRRSRKLRSLATRSRQFAETEPLVVTLVLGGLLMPPLAALEPVQPIRALAAASLLLVLPGLAVTKLLRLREPLLAVAVTVAASAALTVLVSTALFYASVWTWQVSLLLLGLFTAVVATASTYRGSA